jgi:chorismate dehydratase
MYNITAVSYSNTLPFIYGIENSGILKDFSLSLEVPAKCAERFITNQTDIALMPVGAINSIDEFNIITDYCIGASGKVKSVLLLSHKPLAEINTIFLDLESRTSVNLVKVLAKFWWKKIYDWQYLTDSNYASLQAVESMVVIGDKAMDLASDYKYVYDLSEEWNAFTGLPFVFACWVSKKGIDISFINDLNRAIAYGVENKHKAVDIALSRRNYSFDLYEYLDKNIDFFLDKQKQKALNLFLDYKRKI